MKIALKMFLAALPILVMVGLVPIIRNDYILTLVYIMIISGLFIFKKEKKIDAVIFLFGFIMMTIFEYIFISTGVETFVRNSLFNMMPVWLPFLWGYGFVAVKNGVRILEGR